MLLTPPASSFLREAIGRFSFDPFLDGFGLTSARQGRLQKCLNDGRLASREDQAAAYIAFRRTFGAYRARRDDIPPDVLRFVARLQRAASGADWIPPIHRTSSYWEKKFRPSSYASKVDTLGKLLLDPRLKLVFDEIQRQWGLWNTLDLVGVRQGLSRARDMLGPPEKPLTLSSLASIARAFELIAKLQCDRGSWISMVLDAIQVPEDYAFKMALNQLRLFLGHDISSMVPRLEFIVDSSKREKEAPRLELIESVLRSLLDPLQEESLIQVLSFPLGIIPEMAGVALSKQTGERPALQKVHPFSIGVVSSALTLLRLISAEMSRFFLKASEGGGEVPFVWRLEKPLNATQEGFFLWGDPDLFVWSYPASLPSIIYNSIKNPLMIQARIFQKDSGIPFHFSLEQSTQWGDARLDNVLWLKHRDTAQGFALNTILQKAYELLEEYLGGRLKSPDSVRVKLGKVPISKRGWLIEELSRAFGLRDRELIENLLESYLHPGKLRRFSIGDVHKLAAIFQLSGRSDENPVASSGFGLFGIETIGSSAGVVYENLFMPGKPTGTLTVIGIQSLVGHQHSSQELNSILGAFY